MAKITKLRIKIDKTDMNKSGKETEGQFSEKTRKIDNFLFKLTKKLIENREYQN